MQNGECGVRWSSASGLIFVFDGLLPRMKLDARLRLQSRDHIWYGPATDHDCAPSFPSGEPSRVGRLTGSELVSFHFLVCLF